MPAGDSKEHLKLAYYKLLKPANVKYEVLKQGADLLYKTSVDGVSLTTHTSLYNIIADFGFYQHFYKIKAGDVVMDAGANVGILSLYFAKVTGPTGAVHAFEPDSLNIASMQANIKLNPDVKNISIYDLLLWNENKTIDFEEAGTVGSSAVSISDKSKVVKKQAVTIDSWVKNQNLQRLDFIKMDIEGAEIEALDACRDTIARFKPKFAIASYHIVQGEVTYIKVEEFFKSIGYSYKTVTFNKHEIITFAGM